MATRFHKENKWIVPDKSLAWPRRLKVVFQKYTYSLIVSIYRIFNLPLPSASPFVFIVGCGRSGTSILGKLMSRFNMFEYAYEPYSKWCSIHSAFDILDLFTCGSGSFFIDPAKIDVTSSKRAFLSLFSPHKNRKISLEKTPHNIFRVRLLEVFAAGSFYIYIIRNPFDVANSISSLALKNNYRLAGYLSFNQWWGVSDAKWNYLVSECNHHFGVSLKESDIDQLNVNRGLLEWLASVLALQQAKETLGDRLLIIRYEDLVEVPRMVLSEIFCFLGIEQPSEEDFHKAVNLLLPQTKPTHFEWPEVDPSIHAILERFMLEYGYLE